MNSEINILNHIHQTADMGRESLRHLTGLTENKEFKKVLERQIEGYESACGLAEELLKERGRESADCAKGGAVFMANIMSDMKLMGEEETSKAADMVIQGCTKGITEMTKLLNSYDGEDKTVRNFAQSEIENERSRIEEMKRFL